MVENADEWPPCRDGGMKDRIVGEAKIVTKPGEEGAGTGLLLFGGQVP